VVRAGQRVAELEQDRQRALEREARLSAQQIAQGASRDVLEHEILLAFVVDGGDHLDDVWVIQAAQNLALAHEAFDELGVVGDERRLDRFDRNDLTRVSIEAPINHAHPALREEVAQLKALGDQHRTGPGGTS